MKDIKCFLIKKIQSEFKITIEDPSYLDLKKALQIKFQDEKSREEIIIEYTCKISDSPDYLNYISLGIAFASLIIAIILGTNEWSNSILREWGILFYSIFVGLLTIKAARMNNKANANVIFYRFVLDCLQDTSIPDIKSYTVRLRRIE